LYYLPAVIAGSARSAEYYMGGKTEGERLNWRRLRVDWPEPERPRTFAPVRSMSLPGQTSDQTGEAEVKRRRAYGIMRAACSDISNAAEGGRNNGVYRASARAGQLHAAGAMALADAEAAILSAALACGLDQREALTTIASGVRRGIADGPYDFAG
jgi:hypothetical protein